MAPILEWDHVTAAVGDTVILSDFSLRAEEGERLLLYGPSGIGKSSVLKSVLGFIPVREGEIRCCGEALEKRTIWDIRKRIAYIPQNPDIGEGTISSIIDTVFGYKCNGEGPKKERIIELFSEFQIPGSFLEKEFGELSGGEKQRVAVVIGLLLERTVYFLDEITASLDGDLKQTVIRYFTSLTGTTQFIVSHDPEWTKIDGIRVVELQEAMG